MKFECSLVLDCTTHTTYMNVCAGGNTELTGFKARLQRDLCDLLPEYSEVLDVWMHLAPNSCNVAVGSLQVTGPSTGKASWTSVSFHHCVSVRSTLSVLSCGMYKTHTHRMDSQGQKFYCCSNFVGKLWSAVHMKGIDKYTVFTWHLRAEGCAVAHVSHAGVQFQSAVCPCEICGVHSGNEIGFSCSTSVFPPITAIPLMLHTHSFICQ